MLRILIKLMTGNVKCFFFTLFVFVFTNLSAAELFYFSLDPHVVGGKRKASICVSATAVNHWNSLLALLSCRRRNERKIALN